MRNKTQLSQALSELTAREVSEVSGVCTKTIYRIRQNPEYSPGMAVAEKLSAAVDWILKFKKRRK